MSAVGSAFKKVTGAVGLSGGGSGAPAAPAAATPTPAPDTTPPPTDAQLAAATDKMRSRAAGAGVTALGGARDTLGVGGGVTSRLRKVLGTG